MVSGTGCATHPLIACAETIEQALDAALDPITGPDPDWLPVTEKADLLLRLARLRERAAALELKVLAGARDVAVEHCARDAAAWLAAQTHAERRTIAREAALAAGLVGHPITAGALAAGALSTEHARAVITALGELPAELAREVLDHAEVVLVGYCGEFTPTEVRRLGRHVLEVVAPEIADDHLRHQLENEERRAREKTRLDLTPRGDGTTRITGVIPDLTAAILTRALEAYTSPRRPDETSIDDRRTPNQRRGEAFCALVEHLPVDGLPTHGGSPVAVMVNLDLDQLIDDLGAATLDTGADLSPSEVRRLACQHGVIPIVLDGESVPLDLGRSARLFSHHQARAHARTHPTCQTEGCTIPWTWCERHHRQPWSRGGPTDLDHLVFLCPHHHHRAHDPAVETRHQPDGTVEFWRPRRRAGPGEPGLERR